jgi:hypothetical protein
MIIQDETAAGSEGEGKESGQGFEIPNEKYWPEFVISFDSNPPHAPITTWKMVLLFL